MRILVPGSRPIFFLREHRFAVAFKLLCSVFMDIVHAVIHVEEVFNIHILI